MVSVASLRPVKDLPTLVDAASMVVKELPDAQFLLLGEGPDRAKLEAKLASAGITAEQIESALEPAGYLGATDAFVAAALAAHERLDAELAGGDGHG